MTCRYSPADWRDLLYNAVRNAPGGVTAAAAHLTERRGIRIHPEDLRRRLRGADGDTLSTEMLELLADWLRDLKRPDAMSWLQAFNARFDMVAAHMPLSLSEDGADDVAAIRDRLLHLNVAGGVLTAVGTRATSDQRIDARECDELEAQVMAEIQDLFVLRRVVRRAAGRSAEGLA